VFDFDLTVERNANSQDNKLVSFQYLVELNGLVLINTTGDIFVLNNLTKSVKNKILKRSLKF